MSEAAIFTNSEVAQKQDQAVLWSSVQQGIDVAVPDTVALPQEEGLHLVVRQKENDLPVLSDNLRSRLRLSYFALPVAKIIAESRFTQDFWANIHIDRFGVSIYGRNPQAEAAWAKPVNKRSLSSEELAEEASLKEQMRLYMPLWERNLSTVELFEDGVEELTLSTEEYQAEVQGYANKPDPYKEDVLWANKKFVLVSVQEPHVSGVHLVVHPRQTYWGDVGDFRRPWQSGSRPGLTQPEFTQGYLEASAILLATQGLLDKNGSVPFFNPETHFSGNWAADLLPSGQGGRLDSTVVNDPVLRKNEKRNHRPGAVNTEGEPTEFRTAMHGHLYATDSPDKLVQLPARPKKEVPEQWESIVPLRQEEVGKIGSLLQDQLTTYLTTNCQGPLLERRQS